MKPLLRVFLLLSLAYQAQAMTLVGFGASESSYSCASPYVDVSATTNDAGSTFYGNEDRGQSWTAEHTGHLAGVELRRVFSTGDAEQVGFRIGTSADMSSSYISAFSSCVVPAETGDFMCSPPAGEGPLITSGNKYYFVVNSSSDWNIRRSTASVYAGGEGYYDTTKNWNLETESSYDLYFRIYLCEE